MAAFSTIAVAATPIMTPAFGVSGCRSLAIASHVMTTAMTASDVAFANAARIPIR